MRLLNSKTVALFVDFFVLQWSVGWCELEWVFSSVYSPLLWTFAEWSEMSFRRCLSLFAGFLTDDLVSVENNGEQKKYLGVCRLPHADAKVRRLDILTGFPLVSQHCWVGDWNGMKTMKTSVLIGLPSRTIARTVSSELLGF